MQIILRNHHVIRSNLKVVGFEGNKPLWPSE